jgi:hypothetical protein
MGVAESCAFRLCFDFHRTFASTSFEVARSIDRALAALALLIALFKLFDDAVFLRAALTGLFAARVRTAVPPVELLRFRFESFEISLFIFSRIALRTTRTFDAGLLLPTRFRAPDEVASLATRFAVDFGRVAGPAFFAFDFVVVFFDLLRAVIVKLSTRDHSRTRSRYRASPPALQNSMLTLCQRVRQRGEPRTPGGLRSMINSSFITKSSKNQRGR